MTHGPFARVAINGKFITAGPMAVHRVGHELGRAFAAQQTECEIRFLVRATRGADFADTKMPVEPLRNIPGPLWEQAMLPSALRGRLLLNLCNMTPLFVCHAMTMVHDAQVFTVPGSYTPLRRQWLRLHIRMAGRLQRGLLTVSAFAKAELVGLGIAPAERIHVIHNGVDHVARVVPEDGVLDRLGVTLRGYALALANTMPHKNIGVLLRAFARPEMADRTLVLAGSATAADFAALGHPVPPNVILAGYVTDGEMRSLQAHALAICTPSLTEGFGMPPVEGMWLGTPAVIAPCGALPEVCGPDTLQADPHDPGAWAAALLRLQDDPGLWQRQSDIGRAFAAQFTWAAAATRLAQVVRDHTAGQA